ncbi:alpha/beta hydrolase [Histomonas meleagridis]|uniref:alpha/beta hydrolase n=1 Tax=Histomonas meleagridis TaxID=135588 RepID=UPI0035596752|nr:alpha/beta hydrolase [Histomonas meleagridis]KAH0803206.1 alpha/beta hydrolase [Histomonas meleagridis]
MFIIFSFTFILWKCKDKDCSTKEGSFIVPLRYSSESLLNLTIPVVMTNANSKGIPIVFLGPGNGVGNMLKDFNFANTSFPVNPLFFIGYRGVDSDIVPQDGKIKSLISIESNTVKDSLLSKIINSVINSENFHLSDFGLTQRSKDIIKFIKDENIEFFHIISVGEDGSRIGHFLSSQIPQNVVRSVFINPSVPIPHNDTTVRLLAIYRRICRKDPTCPYPQIKWLPTTFPKNIFNVFTVNPERIRFNLEQQLRNPSTAPNAFEALQSITDGSKFGYLSLSSLTGPEMLDLKWSDILLHSCTVPRDSSLYFLPSIEKLCENLTVKEELPGKIESPLLIISGELDLPRPKTTIEYYKNNSLMPSLVDQIYLEKASSRFEMLRPDVLKAILSFLNEGKTEFQLNEPEKIVWKNTIGMTSILKWGMGIGFVFSLGSVAIVYYLSKKGEKGDRKKKND